MLAEIGKTYAQIMHGKCHWIFTIDTLPEWNENDIETVDITGIVVKEGYSYKDGVFSAPVIEPITPVVPSKLSMKQARLALLAADLLDDVEEGIATMSRAAQIEWEFASTVERSSELVITIATTLGLDDTMLDELFTAGSKL